MNRGRGARARARSARERNAAAAFPHTGTERRFVDRLRKLDVDSAGKRFISFELRSERRKGRALGVIDKDDRVRIADGNGLAHDLAPVDVDDHVVAPRNGAHVDGNGARFSAACVKRQRFYTRKRFDRETRPVDVSFVV